MSTEKIFFRLLTVALFAAAFFTSCTEKDEKESPTDVTTSTVGMLDDSEIVMTDTIVTPTGYGCLCGRVLERYGNWMPFTNSSHGERPIVRVVYVYDYTMISDLDSATQHNCSNSFPLASMPNRLVATTTSDSTGAYEVFLAPGRYSLFLLENGRMYCNNGDGYGGFCPVTIDSVGAICQKNLILDHAVY